MENSIHISREVGCSSCKRVEFDTIEERGNAASTERVDERGGFGITSQTLRPRDPRTYIIKQSDDLGKSRVVQALNHGIIDNFFGVGEVHSRAN